LVILDVVYVVFYLPETTVVQVLLHAVYDYISFLSVRLLQNAPSHSINIFVHVCRIIEGRTSRS
jgi:hypothetical protein